MRFWAAGIHIHPGFSKRVAIIAFPKNCHDSHVCPYVDTTPDPPSRTPPPVWTPSSTPPCSIDEPNRTNTINWGIYMTYIGGSDRIQKRFVEEKGKGKNVEGSKNSVTFRLAFPSCATLLNHFSSPMDRGFPFLLGPRFNLECSSSHHQKARQCQMLKK
jgi:hypothetical protein